MNPENEPEAKHYTHKLERPQIFNPAEKKTTKMEKKMMEKILNFYIKIAWQQSLSFQSFVLVVALLYAYEANLPFKDKMDARCVVATCLLLGCKMTKSPLLSIEYVLSRCSKVKQDDLIEKERDLLQMVDYNLYFNFHVCDPAKEDNLSLEQILKMSFLTEVLLCRDSKPLYDEPTVQRIFNAARLPVILEDTLNLIEIFQMANFGLIQRRYIEKFKVLEYMKPLHEKFELKKKEQQGMGFKGKIEQIDL